MNPVVRRRLAVVATLAVLCAVVSGCMSVRAQSQRWYTPGDGVSTEAGDISARNVLLVGDEDAGVATLIATFANSGDEDDQLVSVAVGDTEVTPQDAPVDIPAGGSATLGPDHTRLDVTGADVQPGQFVEVSFVFQKAPRATVDALVQPAEGVYEGALDGVVGATPLAS